MIEIIKCEHNYKLAGYTIYSEIWVCLKCGNKKYKRKQIKPQHKKGYKRI